MDLFSRLFGRARLGIEPLGPSHAPAVSRLHMKNFARGWDQPDVARMLAEQNILADGIFANAAHMPCGFVISRLAADEAEILTICIDENKRRQGLGRMLLEQHVRGLVHRNVGKLFLEVDEHNRSALSLYQRHGFSKVGERPGYYPKSDGSRAVALIMRRDLG